MSKKKEIEAITELFEDLLIDFDEMGFAPTTACPNPDAYSIEWKQKLLNALQRYRKQSEGELHKGNNMHTCSLCGFTYLDRVKTELNYCPNCGVRMKGE